MNAITIDSNAYGHSRDELCRYLKQNNIDTRMLFQGMHRQLSLKNFGCNCNAIYPISDKLADNSCYLPSASSLTEEDIQQICKTIKNW